MKEYSRYERQYILKEIGRDGQKKLDQSRVAIVGLGALGSVSSNMLARAGVGSLVLIDRDFLEMNNLQRQVLFNEKHLAENLPKAVAAKKTLEEINSEIKIDAEVADINSLSIHSLLENVDLIVDGTDNFESRFLINDYCLKHNIPWVYGGAVQTEGMSYVVLPGETPCLRCLFGQAPHAESVQTCDQVGILAPVAHLIASFQTAEAIKILAGRLDVVERNLWKVDLWSRQFKSISVDHLKENPCSGCADQDYAFLKPGSGSQAVTLCGRNSVQISSEREAKLDLGSLAAKLAGQEDVFFNDYLLKLNLEACEITIFSNGRAIVKGTEDVGEAKSLYAKYIGVNFFLAVFLTQIIFFSPLAYSEADTVPTVSVQESSKPLFDVDWFDHQQKLLKPPDEFMHKIRQSRVEFDRKQNREKRKFFDRLNSKNLEAEEVQRRIAKFHSKQQGASQKFMSKLKKKIDKYEAKQQKDVPVDPTEALRKERREFYEAQKKDWQKFYEKLQKKNLDQDKFQEKVDAFNAKQQRAREKFLAG